ncbi:MAG: NAD(+)/NADH kinase, partial [Thermoplasmata archaeon]|nr:NAD(+)/NADH kinase [Thermoplasmata archaeon]
MKIGFVVNPIAGMGGKVGLKGTDGMLQEAIKRGAKKEAPQKAIKFLKALREKKIDVQIFTASHEMGEDECKDAGIKARVVYQCNNPTTAMDTKKACIEFMKHGVDAIVFVGGDGTARDVYSVVKDRIAMLGVPAGVKMYSGVFAFTPEMAAEVIANFDDSVDAEIIDIDEEAFRKDKLELKIYGYAKTLGGNVQQGKILIASDKEMKESIASFMALICRKGNYIIGGGSTTYAIKKALGIEGSFLGVDVVKDGKLVIKDANEEQLLDFL